MAEFQYHGSDSLQTDAFEYLENGDYWNAIQDFQELITRIKFKLKHVKDEQFSETLWVLGKLRRGLAEALWHINRPHNALQIIQLCITEQCHELSEESASLWSSLARARLKVFSTEPQTILTGFEIAVLFTPPNNVLNMSRLLVKMLLCCCQFGQTFQKKASYVLTDLCKIDECQSEEVANIWMDCGKQLMSCKGFVKLSITCFTLALKFLPSSNNSSKAKISYSRATAIVMVNDPSQLDQAIRDAKTSVEQCPSVEGYTLLWKCFLYSKDYDDALASFKETLEFLDSKEEDKYKELVKFFRTAISLKAFKVFKSGCPVPKYFVQRLISESVAKRAVQDLSLLFCEGWAVDCSASCVPLDMVLKSDFKNREELVRVLLQHKALARGLKTSSESPLTVCLQADNSDMAVLLLQHGADVNDLKEREGESALRAALRIGLKKGNFAILKYFFDNRGRTYPVDYQDEDGNTLLHILCRGKIDSKKQEAINILLEAGANPLITNKQKKKPIDIVSNLRDNRRNLLRSAEESFKSALAGDQNTAKKQVATTTDVNVREDKSLPQRSETPSSPSSSGTTSPSIPSSKSRNSTKESLSSVRERIQSLIKKLDVRDWFKKTEKVASHEKATRKTSTKTEKPELKNDQKQTDPVEQPIPIIQEEKSPLSLSKKDNGGIASITSDASIEGAFDGLPWEVECTAEVWKILHGKRLESWKKERFVEKVKTLAQGRDNWTLHLCKRLEGLPKSRGMLLYETRLTDAARIIWECAVAFSPLYSDEDKKCKTARYSEIIRIWDIVFDHDNLDRAVQNIVTSLPARSERGSCSTLDSVFFVVSVTRPVPHAAQL